MHPIATNVYYCEGDKFLRNHSSFHFFPESGEWIGVWGSSDFAIATYLSQIVRYCPLGQRHLQAWARITKRLVITVDQKWVIWRCIDNHRNFQLSMLAPGVPLRSGKAAQSSSTYKMYFENQLSNHIKYLQYNKYLRSCPATCSNSFFRQQSS